MALDLVSLTGADDAVDPAELAALSLRFPFVEWALLYFPEKAGTPRNPSASWRERFLLQGLSHTAAHLCGTAVFQALLNPAQAPALLEDLSRYHRIQVNINAKSAQFSLPEVLSVYWTLHLAGLPLILQYHEGSAQAVQQFLGHAPKNVSLLFDASKGTGQLPEAWPTPWPDLYCGYAGGLGPVVLPTALPKILAASKGHPVWIDMESGVRTANQLDLQKAERILRISRHYLKD